MATDVFGLVLVKKFAYRDNPNEEWSSKYWLSGPIPQSSAEFKAQADVLIGHERHCYESTSRVVRAYGYDAWQPDPPGPVIPSVWSHDYELEGTEVAGDLVDATGHKMAGDQAGYIQWLTDRRSSKGKPIYLRKFMHDGFVDPSARDAISPATLVAYSTFATVMTGGTEPGLGHVRSPVADAAIPSHAPGEWVTTRTLKRRGKRPLAHA